MVIELHQNNLKRFLIILCQLLLIFFFFFISFFLKKFVHFSFWPTTTRLKRTLWLTFPSWSHIYTTIDSFECFFDRTSFHCGALLFVADCPPTADPMSIRLNIVRSGTSGGGAGLLTVTLRQDDTVATLKSIIYDTKKKDPKFKPERQRLCNTANKNAPLDVCWVGHEISLTQWF